MFVFLSLLQVVQVFVDDLKYLIQQICKVPLILLSWGIVITFIYLLFYTNAYFIRVLERKRSDDIVSDEKL